MRGDELKKRWSFLMRAGNAGDVVSYHFLDHALTALSAPRQRKRPPRGIGGRFWPARGLKGGPTPPTQPNFDRYRILTVTELLTEKLHGISTSFSTRERARALRFEADIFHDKNVITRPRGSCNDGPAAAELK